MNAALWGVASALGWGSADFLARFTGRALGFPTALLGMLASSAVMLTIPVVVIGGPPTAGGAQDLAALLGMGIGVTAGTLLLYWGLTRGPIAVVAPIVGSYPAVNLLLATISGTRPTAAQWAAMLATMAGVAMVAALSRGTTDDSATYDRAHVSRSALLAAAGALVFGLTLEAGKAALPVYGELHTVWLVRLVSLALLGGAFVAARRRPRIPADRWPLLTGQGALDATGYLALLAGSSGTGGAVTVVVGSAFSAVTVLLARLVLREGINAGQWVGIALIVAGVTTLSWLST